MAFIECHLCIGHGNDVFEGEKEHARLYWFITRIAMGPFNTFSVVREMPSKNTVFL